MAKAGFGEFLLKTWDEGLLDPTTLVFVDF